MATTKDNYTSAANGIVTAVSGYSADKLPPIFLEIALNSGYILQIAPLKLPILKTGVQVRDTSLTGV